MPQAFRISGDRLSNHIGSTVRIVGRIMQIEDGKQAKIQMTEGVLVTVLGPSGQNYMKSYVEIVGKMEDATTIQEYKSIPIDDGFDLDTFNKMLKYCTGKYSNLFS
mmetsp:Transcript_4711/g.6676  ORF Transcript_4711/g.6676 Transcript_4711/m.6676 type:complete len:106 (-) Transcript_4711:203-520(-)